MKPWLIALLAGLALFATGYWLGGRGPDTTAEVDTLILRSAQTDTLIQTVTRRQTVVERQTDTLEARIDTLTVVLREALPDSLRPVLDSLRASGDAVAALWRAQSEAWKAVADSLKVERDAGLALLRQRVRKPFPIQLVAGIAVTTQGVLPAIGLGLRIPLPRIF